MSVIHDTGRGSATIRKLEEPDLTAADEIFRLAFGTFLGMPDPLQFFVGADYVRGRWLADPDAAFVAEFEGAVVGSNFAGNWGSVGFFGPLTIRPELWDRGIGTQLMEPVLHCFERWQTKHAGLFTFAHSPKHVGLYGKFGFHPRFLTAVTAKEIAPGEGAREKWTAYSELGESDRDDALTACRELTEEIYQGLDLSREIHSLHRHHFGEVVLVKEDDRVVGFAVCHSGPGSEAESGTAFVKFGAAHAEESFQGLLEACEQYAAQQGASRLDAGMNLAREEAYRALIGRGYRTWLQGVVMSRPNEPAYNRPGVFVVDDWR